MFKFSKSVLLVISSLAIIGLSGCGGSSDTTVIPTNTTTDITSVSITNLTDFQVDYQNIDTTSGTQVGYIQFCAGNRFNFIDWNTNAVGYYEVNSNNSNVLTLISDSGVAPIYLEVSNGEFKESVDFISQSNTIPQFNYTATTTGVKNVVNPDCSGTVVPATPVSTVSLASVSSVKNHKVSLHSETYNADAEYTFCDGGSFQVNYGTTEEYYGTWDIVNSTLVFNYDNGSLKENNITSTDITINTVLTVNNITDSLSEDLNVTGILDYTNATVKPGCPTL